MQVDLTNIPRPPAYRVLVVDDDRDTVDSTMLFFELQGHEARGAYDGPQAVSQAVAFRPDVVLLDLAMPEMDGYQVARALRQINDPQDQLLAAVTGLGERMDKLRAAEAGFDLHLVKPIDFTVFEQMILLWRDAETTRVRARDLVEQSHDLATRQNAVVAKLIDLKIEMAGTMLDVAVTSRNPATKERCLHQACKTYHEVSGWLCRHKGEVRQTRPALQALQRRYEAIVRLESREVD